MRRKIKRVTVDNEVKYRGFQKDHWYSKWVSIEFTLEDTGEKITDLTIEQLESLDHYIQYEGISDCYDDLKKLWAKQNIEEHKTPYQILKMADDSRMCTILQKASEIGELSDGYHTFNELYDFRREYNAALVNSGVWKSHKSHKHHTGEPCFGGGWFIVMMETPFGQISNHYEDKYWDEFHCEEKEVADEWDGHTEKDVLERLSKCNK